MIRSMDPSLEARIPRESRSLRGLASTVKAGSSIQSRAVKKGREMLAISVAADDGAFDPMAAFEFLFAQGDLSVGSVYL
jgi:hypothetical protein